MRVRLSHGAHVVWDCLFTTGYPGFGVPVPLFIGYLISNLILLETNNIAMNKRDLKKLTKKQLIKLLLKQQAQKPRNRVNEHEDIIQPPEQFRDTYKPIPHKSVKQMVNEHEDIIQPPEQFRDTYKPIPPPRTGKWESVKPKPVP